MDTEDLINNWFVSINENDITLKDAYKVLENGALMQSDIPLIVQMIENPKYDLPGIEIFNGSTDLFNHDMIHFLLGRGFLAKDEAFVLGFTMGSTNRVTAMEEKLYSFFTKYIYPKPYNFDDDDLVVFKNAVRLGYISNCTPLNTVDFKSLFELPVGEVRKKVGLETDLIKAYFRIEQNDFKHCPQSTRLL
ncbi:MAG TPA: hypothetical protein EYQ86_08075 [Bacteroidetes bacterium]|nr:hypothetical protein [Bacteroidota bacterium]